jgi:hypothetical protein
MLFVYNNKKKGCQYKEKFYLENPNPEVNQASSGSRDGQFNNMKIKERDRERSSHSYPMK